MSKAFFSLLLIASQIPALLEQQLPSIPVPAASPGTGWAGVTGVNGAVVTQLRVLILHCGLRVQLLIALCRGWRVRQPRIGGASGAGSSSLLSVLLECWSPGTAPVWRDPRDRQGSPSHPPDWDRDTSKPFQVQGKRLEPFPFSLSSHPPYHHILFLQVGSRQGAGGRELEW